ncbi:MAG TPA: hypothetical protein DEB74_12420 [Lachnospiraceae bacterium]|nr:hypothetical protein [Lachnospiraceae bacterium]
MHKREEYAELYDAADVTAVWSEPHGDIRMRIKVASTLPADYDKTTLSALLRRALKEMLIRRNTQYADIDNITDSNVIQFCTVLRQHVVECLRDNLADGQHKMSLAIITKILKDYYDRQQ